MRKPCSDFDFWDNMKPHNRWIVLEAFLVSEERQEKYKRLMLYWANRAVTAGIVFA
jgi:hypothetical protein